MRPELERHALDDVAVDAADCRLVRRDSNDKLAEADAGQLISSAVQLCHIGWDDLCSLRRADMGGCSGDGAISLTDAG
jgi:hypothetical protein